MRRYVRQREGSGEAAEEMAAGRKRKFALEESELSTSSVQVKTRGSAVTASPASSGNSTCQSVNSGYALSSCSSSSRSSVLAKETPKSADLEENAVTVEYIATSAGHLVGTRDRREQMTPSREVHAESGELELTARPPESNPRHRSAAEKMPTDDELEDFFSAAEKNLQKQFIDKYNFDIANDKPLEGRYEWVPVQLKP